MKLRAQGIPIPPASESRFLWRGSPPANSFELILAQMNLVGRSLTQSS